MIDKKMEDRDGGGEIWVNKFTEESAQKFREQVMEISRENPDVVIPIYIDSYGGYVDSLAKMLATMDEVPNRFITICMGKAMSCGAILLSHGDLRFIDKYSRTMVHNVSSWSWGDVYSMKAGTDETVRLNKKFMGLLAHNTGRSYDALQKLIKDSTDSKEIWMSAEDTIKFGLADQVGIPVIKSRVEWSCALAPLKLRAQETPVPKKAKKQPKKKAKKKR